MYGGVFGSMYGLPPAIGYSGYPTGSLRGVTGDDGYNTPYSPDDFTHEEMENAKRVWNALKAFKYLPAHLRKMVAEQGVSINSSLINAIESALGSLDVEQVGVTNIFDIVGPQRDPDSTIYPIYAQLYDAVSSKIAASPAIVKQWKELGDGLVNAHEYASFDEMVSALGQAYDDYFDAYWDADAGKAQAATGQAVAARPSKTGKPRKVAVPKPTPKPVAVPRPSARSGGLGMILLVGGLALVVGGGIYYFSKKR